MVEYRGRKIADIDEVIEALTPCLALVAPTGFSMMDRQEWLAAAAVTVAERKLTQDVLKDACKAARNDPECDHPAKIMPAILRYLGPNHTTVLQSSMVPDYSPHAQMQFEEWRSKLSFGTVHQSEIDDKPDQWKRVAVEQGFLRRVGEGIYVQRQRKMIEA